MNRFKQVVVIGMIFGMACPVYDAAAEMRITFACGGSSTLTVDVSARSVIVGRDESTKARGEKACRDLIANKAALCRKILSVAQDSHEFEAMEEGKRECEREVARRQAGLKVGCLETSRSSCEDPSDCSPSNSVAKGCQLTPVIGAVTRKAAVYPHEVGGYRDDQECSLLCSWEMGVAGQSASVKIGCSPCEEGAAVASSSDVSAHAGRGEP